MLPEQALVLCRRYADAQAQAAQLLPGVDSLYLQAEALWRAGATADAMQRLREALEVRAGSTRCLERMQLLTSIQELDTSSACAADEGITPAILLPMPHDMPGMMLIVTTGR